MNLPRQAKLQRILATIESAAETLRLPPSLDKATRRTLRGDALVPRAFVDLAIETAKDHPSLFGITFDLAAEQHLAAIEALAPIVSSLKQLVRLLDDAILRERAAEGRAVNSLFKHLQVLAHTEHRDLIVDPLERMTAIRRRHGKRPKDTSLSASSPS